MISEIWWHLAEIAGGVVSLTIVVYLLFKKNISEVQQQLIDTLKTELEVWKQKATRVEAEREAVRDEKHKVMVDLSAATLMIKDLEKRTDFTPFQASFQTWCDSHTKTQVEMMKVLQQQQSVLTEIQKQLRQSSPNQG